MLAVGKKTYNTHPCMRIQSADLSFVLTVSLLGVDIQIGKICICTEKNSKQIEKIVRKNTKICV